jgi:hypothetical protein
MPATGLLFRPLSWSARPTGGEFYQLSNGQLAHLASVSSLIRRAFRGIIVNVPSNVRAEEKGSPVKSGPTVKDDISLASYFEPPTTLCQPMEESGQRMDALSTRTPMRLYDAYIFDLDGTVYLGEALLPTAGATITELRDQGRRTAFLSNNPTHTRLDYAAKLTRLGLPTPAEDIINSSVVMVDFLRRHLPGGRLFVVGEEPLCQELRTAGFELTDDARRVDAVIASFDRTFVYRKP